MAYGLKIVFVCVTLRKYYLIFIFPCVLSDKHVDYFYTFLSIYESIWFLSLEVLMCYNILIYFIKLK